MVSVFSSAFRLLGAGALVGLAGAFAVSRLLGDVVAGISGTDALTYIVVIVLIAVVGCSAALLPAVRAATVEPVRALRRE
jgi:putative ABC transport system permease protein